MSVVSLSRLCIVRVLEELWWMGKAFFHIRVWAEGGKSSGCCCTDALRGQRTTWPSVPAVRIVVGERKTHWVRQEVE